MNNKDNNKLYLLISLFVLFCMYPVQKYNGNKYLLLFLFNSLIIVYNHISDSKNKILNIYNMIYSVLYMSICYYISKTSTKDDNTIRLILVKIPTAVNIFVSSTFALPYIIRDGFKIDFKETFLIKIFIFIMILTFLMFALISNGIITLWGSERIIFTNKRIDYQKYFFYIFSNLWIVAFNFFTNLDLKKNNQNYKLYKIINISLGLILLFDIILICLTEFNIFKFRLVKYSLFIDLLFMACFEIYCIIIKRKQLMADIEKYIFIIIPIIAYVLYIVVYPGHIASDSMDQLSQASSNSFSSWHAPISSYIWQFLLLFPSGGGMFFITKLIFIVCISTIIYTLIKSNLYRGISCLIIFFHPQIFNISLLNYKDISVMISTAFVIFLFIQYLFKERKISYLLWTIPAILYLTGLRQTNYSMTVVFITLISYLVYKNHRSFIFNFILINFLITFIIMLLSPGSIGIKKGLILILFLIPLVVFKIKKELLNAKKGLSISIMILYMTLSCLVGPNLINSNKFVSNSNILSGLYRWDMTAISIYKKENVFPHNMFKPEYQNLSDKEIYELLKDTNITSYWNSVLWNSKFTKLFHSYEISKKDLIKIYLKNFPYWVKHRLTVTMIYLLNGNPISPLPAKILNSISFSPNSNGIYSIIQWIFWYNQIIYFTLAIIFLFYSFFENNIFKKDERMLILIRVFAISSILLFLPMTILSPSTDTRYLISSVFMQILSVIFFIKMKYQEFKDNKTNL